ncbi:MAG: glycosyltransferase family 4 protein [Saprospiraceae bacterium]
MYDYDVIISFVTAFSLTYFVIPPIINVAIKKNLCDEPGGRHSHTVSTPRLGGIAIFAGVLFSVILWTPFDQYANGMQYILCAFILILLVGVKDDIDAISPSKKLATEVLAAVILVFKAGVRVSGLHNIMGIGEIPFFWSVLLTVFVIIVIINSFNLIDGINGLSGSIAILVSGILGIWFLLVRRYELAILALSTTGATVAFLKFNYSPAKIFMGDTGSLFIGMVCSILVISFIEYNEQLDITAPFKINVAPAVAIGIFILPLFDTFRVFVTRVANGRHPLRPDRTHIHHLLIDAGLNHMQATFLLVGVNMFFVVLVFLLQRYTDKGFLIILLLGGIASLLAGGLFYTVKRKDTHGIWPLSNKYSVAQRRKKKTAPLPFTEGGRTQNIHEKTT